MRNTIEQRDDGPTGSPAGHESGSDRSEIHAGSGSGGTAGVGPGDAAVVVSQISKTFYPSPRWMRLLLKSAIDEPVVALDDVSFEVGHGEICVIIGPNGAGKSTLFRILTGLTVPTGGTARIMGHDVRRGRVVRSLIGFMPAEDRNLMLRHTCAQNLLFRGKLQGLSGAGLVARVDEVLEQTGIGHARDRAAISLSTGMKARLQLAAAILHRPRLLILDEPTSAVDPVGAHELLTLIERITAELGLSVLISSHRLEEIDALQNKVVLLDQGRVIHNGNLRTLRHLYEEPRYRIEFEPQTDLADVVGRLTAAGFEADVGDGAIEVATSGSVGALMGQLGPATDAIVSFDRAEVPLRVLMHKLITGQVEGER